MFLCGRIVGWGFVAGLLAATVGLSQAPPSGATSAPSALAATLPGPATHAAATALLPVPDAAAARTALELIKTLFKDAYARPAPAERIKLARVLLQQAGETHDNPAAAYVLLEQAGELGALGGDAALGMAALEQLAGRFAVDGLELKVRLLTRALAAAGGAEAYQSIATAGLETLEQAAAADRFDKATALADVAEAAANRSQKVAFAVAVQPRLADYRALAVEFGRAQRGLARLAERPDDAEANLAVGRYYGLLKGDFARALPYLAKSSDAGLRAAAEKELAQPADPAAQVALADAWWDAAAKLAGPARQRALAHAGELYQTARASVTGLTLTRIDDRIRATTQAERVGTAAAGSGINLLALVDPAQDASVGKWSLKELSVSCESISHACLQLPYQAPPEYDLTVTFARTKGDGPVVVLLTGRGEAFGLSLDNQGHTARLEMVNRKIAKDNPTNTPCTLLNGRAYTLVVQVRKDGVTALLDGKLLLQWKTDYRDLARYSAWKLKDVKLLGIGASSCEVTFGRIELTPVSGEGRKVR